MFWLACLATGLTGSQVSSPNFNTSTCWPAQVPGTIFTTLLHNKQFNLTDPFFEADLYNAPDINVTGRNYWTYYWRTEIIQEEQEKEENPLTWLRLRGINYRARVYVDGNIISED